MRCYAELPCEYTTTISNDIFNFIKNQTALLNTTKFGWHFIDCKKLLSSSSSLLIFFKQHKLIPRTAAITIITDNTHLDKHIDALPIIAKINFPVINTQGWANRWYVDDVLVAELLDMKYPIVFNSQIMHSVEKTTAIEIPRIVASFTFHNDLLELLK
jgi:hypothetical protein